MIYHKAKKGNNLTPAYPAGPLIRTDNKSVVKVMGDPTHGQYTTMRQHTTNNTFISTLPDTGFTNRRRKSYQHTVAQPVLYH